MKTKILNLKVLQRNEMKAINGAAAIRKCCEWGESPKGQPICLVWSDTNGGCP